MIPFSLILAIVQTAASSNDVGSYVRTLWLLHHYGTEAATDSRHDAELKSALARGLTSDARLTFNEIGSFMTSDQFQKLAGQNDTIEPLEVAAAVDASIPTSRSILHAEARRHAELLTTTFDQIDDGHRNSAGELADWMLANYEDDRPLDVIVVCTGNSRRSILGSSMGNLAAAFYGLPNIRFHSGGTAPSAFNARTVQALKAAGFRIEATGKEAMRGDPETANPVYRVEWGEGLSALEFSKHFADPTNPPRGFAAVMVCTEADAGCPHVAGATLRLSMPFADPKSYDGSSFESQKYAERRDDIGRTFLNVLCQVRRGLDHKRNALGRQGDAGSNQL